MSEYRECWLCGRNGSDDPLDMHHIFEGRTGMKEKSERYGLLVPLCHDRCHIFGRRAVHNCRENDLRVKKFGQAKAMIEQGWNVDEFRMVFGKNWLDEDEIEEIKEIQAGRRDAAPYGGIEGFEVIEEDEDDLPEWLRCA